MQVAARRLAVVLILVVSSGSMVAAQTSAANEIPHPDAYFGRSVGAPGVLIPHARILDYYRLLEERSDRVRLHELGETTEGRSFYHALLSSPANLARIDELVAANAKLYDPRGVDDSELEAIVRDNPAFVIVNEQIHSTEVGVSQGGILLAWRLATGEDAEVRRILDEVVVAHVPVHNPDGQERVIEWLDRWRGTPYENAPPPFLYQKYVGHDNNRDWYMFTQVETRHSIRMQNRLHPQFTLDQHQQGSYGSRIFVPPFEDPWEPNVDPAIIASNNMIGTFMGQYLTARGYRGVEWKERYDAWTPARAYYHTHGGVRILTEVASARFADDLEVPPERLGPDYRRTRWNFPMPWPGGTWSFGEVVDYHYASAMAALVAAADLRPALLRGMLAAQRRSVEPPTGSPAAFLLAPDAPDPPAAERLLEVLEIGDVELQRAVAGFEAGGRDYPAGTVVIAFAQPAGRFAKSVLEEQDYPRIFLYEGGPLDPPYDVTAHTLPLLMNVPVDEVAELSDVATESFRAEEWVEGRVRAPSSGPVAAYLMDPAVNRSYSVAAALAGDGLRRAMEGFRAGGRHWPAGTWIQDVPAAGRAVALRRRLDELAAAHDVEIVGVATVPPVRSGWVGQPRVAIYQSNVPSMPEGWTRYILDDHEIPYTVLADEDVRRGDLGIYDVLLLPPGDAESLYRGRSSGAAASDRAEPPTPPEFAGGLGDAGVEALRAYVRGGGTLLAWGEATDFLRAWWEIDIDRVDDELNRRELNIPGSLLRLQVDDEHPLAYGMGEEAAVLYWNGPVWEVPAEATVVGRYASEDLLLSGWIQGGEHLAGRPAMLEVPEGDGRLVLVGFSPEYRAQAHGTFKVLFNAMFRPRPE